MVDHVHEQEDLELDEVALVDVLVEVVLLVVVMVVVHAVAKVGVAEIEMTVVLRKEEGMGQLAPEDLEESREIVTKQQVDLVQEEALKANQEDLAEQLKNSKDFDK